MCPIANISFCDSGSGSAGRLYLQVFDAAKLKQHLRILRHSQPAKALLMSWRALGAKVLCATALMEANRSLLMLRLTNSPLETAFYPLRSALADDFQQARGRGGST